MANGGSGNDIQFAIANEESFENFRNGHPVNVYYNSGQLTTNNFDIALPSSGIFFVIYSNIFLSFSGKRVNTRVDFTMIFRFMVKDNTSSGLSWLSRPRNCHKEIGV